MPGPISGEVEKHGLHNALSDSWVMRQPSGWSAIAEFQTWPQALADSGYRTAMIGKWHIGDPRTASHGFQHWVAMPYGHTIDFWDNTLVENGRSEAVEEIHIVDALTQKAVDYLETVPLDRPFYLQLSLDGPYALPPSNAGPARNRHYEKYARKGETHQFRSMPLGPINDEILKSLNGPYVPDQDIFSMNDLDGIWDHLHYGTIRMQSDPQTYANFLSQNAMVDDAVGRVRSVLERRGLDGQTLIIYSADQGNYFGQHGTWGHAIWFTPAEMHEETVHIPLIVRDPRGSAGRVSSRLVGQYDLAPTLLELLSIGEASFENSPGRSFAAELRDDAPEPDQSQAVFFEQEETRGLRTARYAYWKPLPDLGAPRLYDLETDPGQRHDLYPQLETDPQLAILAAQLDARLDGFFSVYTDPAYDLWRVGVAKGTPPKPFYWLKRNPWPWVKKYWQDLTSQEGSLWAFLGLAESPNENRS
jgi:arylsulfatase A-like enzyme